MMMWDSLKKSIGLGGNRRHWRRDPVQLSVTLIIAGVRHAFSIADVSPNGAFVTPASDLPVGSEGVLELPGAFLQVGVRVVRQTPTGLGLEFLADGAGAIVAGWVKGSSNSA